MTQSNIIRPEIITAINDTAFALIGIDWSKYGDLIKMQDEHGKQKYQGYLAGGMNLSSEEFLSKDVGKLADIKVSEETLLRKFEVLGRNPLFIGSVQGRNPLKKYWGGAQRSSINPDTCYGLTGAPELVDINISSGVMLNYKELTVDDFITATYYGNVYIQQALDFVGMTTVSYQAMQKLILQMVDEV